MKKFTLFLILLQSTIALAQAPQKMAYQSVVRNASNQIVANQNIGVKIMVYRLEHSLIKRDIGIKLEKNLVKLTIF